MSTTYKLKVLLCGPAAVGKTSLIYRFIKEKFQTEYKLTVGVDILTKEVEYEPGKFCLLSIWDIGGQERFSFIRTTFYKGASGVLLVFDLSRAATWDSVKNWRAEVKQFAGDIPFVLIGNKKDLLAEVGESIDRDEPQDYADEEDSIYIETSAKTGEKVDESFLELARLIITKSESE